MEKNMFNNTLVLQSICLHSRPVQLFFLHRTSSCFQRIISSEGFWKRKFAQDGLMYIDLPKQDYVREWLTEYNKRRSAKLAMRKFGDSFRKHTLEEINSIGIKDITPAYDNYYCEINFCRRKDAYFYVLHVVRKIDRQPGRFYHDVKRYQSYKREMPKEDFYRLLFLYHYKLD
jgi:hypothetical protein